MHRMRNVKKCLTPQSNGKKSKTRDREDKGEILQHKWVHLDTHGSVFGLKNSYAASFHKTSILCVPTLGALLTRSSWHRQPLRFWHLHFGQRQCQLQPGPSECCSWNGGSGDESVGTQNTNHGSVRRGYRKSSAKRTKLVSLETPPPPPPHPERTEVRNSGFNSRTNV